jgi:hypothetical protein
MADQPFAALARAIKEHCVRPGGRVYLPSKKFLGKALTPRLERAARRIARRYDVDEAEVLRMLWKELS